MSNWPTTENTPARRGYAAHPTPITPEAWRYDLSVFTVPAETGTTSSQSYDFDANAQGWIDSYHAFPASWTNTDGSPAPGCLNQTLFSNSNAPTSAWSNAAITLDWTARGMPANGHVTHVYIQFNIKHNPADPFPGSNHVPVTVKYAEGNIVTLWSVDDIESIADWTSYSADAAFSNAPAPGASLGTFSFNSFTDIVGFSLTAWPLIDHVTVHADWATDDLTEDFSSSPVVSDGGYIFALTQRTDGAVFLLCVDNTGALQSHTRITNEDGSDPDALYTLSTDGSDNAYILAEDCVKSYTTDGTLRWTHGDAASFSTVWQGSGIDPDTGLVWVGNDLGGTVVMEALNPANGIVDHSFDTGYIRAQESTTFGLLDGFLYLPMDLSLRQPGIGKWATDGTPAWVADISAMGNGFRPETRGVSIYGDKVHAWGLYDASNNDVAIVTLQDIDGALDWITEDYYYADPHNGEDGPAVDEASGRVFVPLGFADPTRCLAAIDPDDGSTIWTYSDAAETKSGVFLHPPSIGSDGYLLLARNSLCRIRISDGALDAKAIGPVNPFAPALSSLYTYVTDGSTPGILYAFGSAGITARAAIGALVRAQLQNVTIVPVGGDQLRVRASVGGLNRAGVSGSTPEAALEVYFAGVNDAGDFTGIDYGRPTVFTLFSPVPGHEYILEKPAADLAGFLSGVMGNVKLRREGAGGNYAGPIIVRAIEIVYNEKPS